MNFNVFFLSASFKQQCPAGHYSTAGSMNCQKCNAGYRCQMGSDTPSPLTDQCDQGGHCDGELFTACPAGTYNPLNTSTSVAACIPCPSGEFYILASLWSLQVWWGWVCNLVHIQINAWWILVTLKPYVVGTQKNHFFTQTVWVLVKSPGSRHRAWLI